MFASASPEALIEILRSSIVQLVRRDGPDLSARQLAVLLTCYVSEEAQTVRGLSAALGVSKPAITRALDWLSEFDLVRRKIDPADRRSVLVQRTVDGLSFIRDLQSILAEAASASTNAPAASAVRPRLEVHAFT